jgi:hypothetical protein
MPAPEKLDVIVIRLVSICVQSKNEAACCYSPIDAPSTTVSSWGSTTKTSTTRSAHSSRGTSNHAIDSPNLRETDFSRKNFPSSRTVSSVENAQHGRDSNEQEPTVLASNSDTADIQELRNRVHELEQLLSNSGGAQLPGFKNGPLAPKAVVVAHGSMSKTHFFGEGHWMNSFKQVRKLIFLR